MKGSWFYLFITVFFSLYGGINFYIGYRGWQTFVGKLNLINSRLYWLIYWFIALSYIIARLTQKFMPRFISEGLTILGSYWLAAMLYLLILLLIIDMVRLLDKWLKFIPADFINNLTVHMAAGGIILSLVAVTLIYGTWNARSPIVKNYNVKINKQAGDLDQLHVVMVSDIHLGILIDNRRLTNLVEMINRQKPDIVLLPGDVIDEDIQEVKKQKMAETFNKIKSPYGVYAVFGNHENIGGHGDEVEEYLKEGGINVLRDNYIKVADSFYIIGRKDRSSMGSNGKRKTLAELIKGIDTSLPMILLDHQPSNLDEPVKELMDLQLSGHTHRGQFFPIQYITQAIYEKDYGYLQKGNFQLIVSSGYGTWGPPIRVGNKPEIVDIIINFK